MNLFRQTAIQISPLPNLASPYSLPDKFAHERFGSNAGGVQKRWGILAGITVAAATLGGGTERWAEGIILFLIGLILIISPPSQRLGRPILLICGVLLALSTIAFLPVRWFGLPEWRVRAAQAVGLPLPSTLTPQPWLTGEAVILLVAGIAWYHLLWDSQVRTIDRSGPMRFFTAGITLLSAVSLYFYFATIPWPFPESAAHFGPFPSKNQIATVLALASMTGCACVYDAIRFRRGTVLMTLCTGINMVGLAVANSRAATIMFLLGLCAWMVSLTYVNRSRSVGSIGLGIISLLLLAFVVFAGGSIDRFHSQANGGQDISQDLRWAIHKDAAAMSLTSPLAGVGLGNFRSVFELFHHSIGSQDYDVVHPESDWLWLADEAGWPACLLVFISSVLLLSGTFPLKAEQPDWHLRAAGIASAFIFIGHGFVDVSGHRLGSAMAGLYAMSFAVPPANNPSLSMRRLMPGLSRWCPAGIGWRLAGILMLLTGILWTWASATRTAIPGAVGVAVAEERLPQLNLDGKYQEAINLATMALQWAPMDWTIYYERAVAESYKGDHAIPAAVADFQRARFLEPTTPDLPYKEGLAWRSVRPNLVYQAWKEALMRTSGSNAYLYQNMMLSVRDFPALLPALERLADNNPSLELIYCANAPHAKAAETLESILKRDPRLANLGEDQKREFFKLSSGNFGPARIAPLILANPEWLPAGWPIAIDYLAAKNNYRQAYGIAAKYSHPAAAPRQTERRSLQELAYRYYSNSSDLAAGIALYRQFLQSGKADDALILGGKLVLEENCPAYVYVLQAGLLADSDQWQQAFDTLNRASLQQQ